MSANISIKDRFLKGIKPNQENLPANQESKVKIQAQHDLKVNEKAKFMNQSKSRSSSQNMASMKNNVSLNSIQNQAHYQNLSRKTFKPTSSSNTNKPDKPKHQQETKHEGGRKKFDMSLYTLNPLDILSEKEFAAQSKEREIDQVKELPSCDDNHDPVSQKIKETLEKFKQKLESANRKVDPHHLGKGKGSKEVNVSSFDAEKYNQKTATQHNSDQLVNTEDHSDIKHTQKTLFESTAPMTAKTSFSAGGANSLKTPATFETSQFTLNVLGESIQKTPSQFQSNQSKSTLQNTDDQGNRLSLLPSAKRPKVPSSKKKDCASKKKKDAVHQSEEPLPVEEFKNPLDKFKATTNELKIKQESKGIVKERTNFVRLNMNKNYKPRMRGQAYSNKIMAKKRNFIKNNERFKKKMQIERAKNRDQVNAYGGLGKVGLDHDKTGRKDANGDEAEEELIPTFSASAMKYIKKAPVEEEDDEEKEVDEFLVEDLENMKEALEGIDEEVKEESLNDLEDADFDKPLYKKLPKSDEEYVEILKERFGHTSFKEGQLESLKILLEKKDNALVVLATGGGKSLIYQYASMFLPGLILIVTPLISLMTDQLNKLPSFITGAAINSQQNYMMKRQINQAIVEKKIKMLFISPERFFIEDFTKFNRPISMVCVDEIHCASEWSHNFRPTYLKIHDMIKEKLGGVSNKAVTLGLTATATKATQKSICETFEIKYPEHRITQEDLSRINLQLSITRDHEKQKSLLSLLRSESFKKLDSILIYATHKRTCELLANFLTQNGINSCAYHAGKTDQQRQQIQKYFIANQIKVLVCTIAFSMGIDKSDIQSVIHYDMPKSIENYVQEIGRAGRDGKLARCHLFLNNEDFFLIRRLILTDLLDNYNALKLTNKIIVEAKKSLLKQVKPEVVVNTKKRKIKQISQTNNADDIEEYTKIIEEFEHEHELATYYKKDAQTGQMTISLDQFEDLSDQYVFLDVKEQLQVLDLKREVIMTMLNSLEKLRDPTKRFFKFEGVLPGSVGIRFHKASPQDMAMRNDFIKTYLKISKEHQGVHRCSIQKLAQTLQISPFQIPKILYTLQSVDEPEMTYETDQDCFILKLKHIPYGGQTLDLANEMLVETRRIEHNMVSKLNCMYFVARKVSLPNVEHMLKREKQEDATAMYKGFSKQLNDLINMYFNISIEEDMEIQIAGNKEERDIMLPLQRISSHREKAEIESDIKMLLKDFHDQGQSTNDPNERMKPLDVVKILMGIYSERANIKRFMNNSKVWAKFQEYDNNEIYQVASATVNQYYLDMISGGTSSKEKESITEMGKNTLSKKRRLND